MKHLAVSLALSLIAATSAAADCPTAADMETGVVLKTADGISELHRKTRPGWTRVKVDFGDGDGSVLEYRHGLYLQSSIPVEAGVLKVGDRETFSSLPTAQAWDSPTPGRSWTNTREDGGTASAGTAYTAKIGGCSYEAFDVVTRFADDPGYSETYLYLPDLGIGLLTVTDDGTTVENYSYTSISRSN